jgi:hypothetical protein
MEHLVWAGVVLVLGLSVIVVYALHLKDVRRRTLNIERDLASMRSHAEAEFVAAKQALLTISGGLESRIRDLEMKVN